MLATIYTDNFDRLELKQWTVNSEQWTVQTAYSGDLNPGDTTDN